jgi:hypothetical protein
MKLDFIITGTGRCGTGYMATVLGACGLRVGHEDVFGPTGIRKLAVQNEFHGDCSWMAVPFIESGESKADVVVTQVRHPLSVISSYLDIGTFSKTSSNYSKFMFRNEPDISRIHTERLNAILWYLRWNQRAMSVSDLVWNVENIPYGQLRDFLSTIGGNGAMLDSAISSVPSNVNGSGRIGTLTWDDISDSDIKEELMEFSALIGYGE